MLCVEGICGCDVQLSAEFRAEIKASPHPEALLCVMPALKSSQRSLGSGCGEGTRELHPKSCTRCARGARAARPAHPPCVCSLLQSCFPGAQASWKEPVFPPRQKLSLWRERSGVPGSALAVGLPGSPSAQHCSASRGEIPPNPSLVVGSGGKGEEEPQVLSMGSVSFVESHIQMDYMRNLTSCLKTNHSLCSSE